MNRLIALAGHLVMAQDGDLLRLRNDASGRECVLRYDEEKLQVYSVGPDSPPDGTNFARATAAGIEYVANWVSPSAARSRFKSAQRNQ